MVGGAIRLLVCSTYSKIKDAPVLVRICARSLLHADRYLVEIVRSSVVGRSGLRHDALQAVHCIQPAGHRLHSRMIGCPIKAQRRLCLMRTCNNIFKQPPQPEADMQLRQAMVADKLTAEELMSTSLVALPPVVPLRRLLHVLSTCRHTSFPVTENPAAAAAPGQVRCFLSTSLLKCCWKSSTLCSTACRLGAGADNVPGGVLLRPHSLEVAICKPSLAWQAFM